MDPETPVQENLTLAAVRSRGLAYLNYLFWALSAAGLLIALNLAASLLQRWVGFLGWLRTVLAIPPPTSGPDLYMLAGFAAALAAILAAAVLVYSAYRGAWTRRLVAVWHNGYHRIDTRVLRLSAQATEREIATRQRYLDALSASPEWSGLDAAPSLPESRAAYTARAEQFLKRIELDIAHRAITAGLVVGLNRNAVLDALSIVAAAFELQLHVLSRLGKRPSPRLWMELLKRTGGSLFLNWYVSREDALYLKLAIKKTAWGMTAASDLAQQAADAIDDMDWHEALGGGGGIPGLHLVGSLTASGLGIGAFGLRHLGSFIESTSDDLLQGVLAAGVLYYHGMALAAECLALDLEHRRGPAMNRTVSQAMGVALAPAAALLRDQVRLLRQFLRERRRLAFAAVKDKVTRTSSSVWDTIKDAARWGPRDIAPESFDAGIDPEKGA